MSENLAFKWKMVSFGLVWFGLVWFGFSYFGSLSLVKFGTMLNLKSIRRELIEIFRFINTVTLVQFWLKLFFLLFLGQKRNREDCHAMHGQYSKMKRKKEREKTTKIR